MSWAFRACPYAAWQLWTIERWLPLSSHQFELHYTKLWLTFVACCINSRCPGGTNSTSRAKGKALITSHQERSGSLILEWSWKSFVWFSFTLVHKEVTTCTCTNAVHPIACSVCRSPYANILRPHSTPEGRLMLIRIITYMHLLNITRICVCSEGLVRQLVLWRLCKCHEIPSLNRSRSKGQAPWDWQANQQQAIKIQHPNESQFHFVVVNFGSGVWCPLSYRGYFLRLITVIRGRVKRVTWV